MRGARLHEQGRKKIAGKPASPRLSVGIVPVRREPGTGRPLYLLLRAYRYWDFPKGLQERGEGALQTALRELREEAGIATVTLKWGEAFVETPPYRGAGGRKIARYYLGEVGGREPRGGGKHVGAGRAEHHERRWVRYEEALTLLGPRLRPVLSWARARVLALAQDRAARPRRVKPEPHRPR